MDRLNSVHSRICVVERVLTTAGLVVAAGALMSILLVGLAIISPSDLMVFWGLISAALAPGGLEVDRALRPLFWNSRFRSEGMLHLPRVNSGCISLGIGHGGEAGRGRLSSESAGGKLATSPGAIPET